MTIAAVMQASRRLYRSWFAPEPPRRLDGGYIKLRMLFGGLSWDQALHERSQMNIARAEAWKRGEVVS